MRAPHAHLVDAFDTGHAVRHAAHVLAGDERRYGAAQPRRRCDGVERRRAHRAAAVLHHHQAADLPSVGVSCAWGFHVLLAPLAQEYSLGL